CGSNRCAGCCQRLALDHEPGILNRCASRHRIQAEGNWHSKVCSIWHGHDAVVDIPDNWSAYYQWRGGRHSQINQFLPAKVWIDSANDSAELVPLDVIRHKEITYRLR